MKEHNLDINEFDLSEIESIELIGEEDTIDIVVEDTHMFFANDIYTHNSGLEDDHIEGDKIAEAYEKVWIADFILSVQRKTADKISDTGTVHIIKNRFGPDGMNFPAKIALLQGKFEILDSESVEGAQQNDKIHKADSIIRKHLKERYVGVNLSGNRSEVKKDAAPKAETVGEVNDQI